MSRITRREFVSGILVTSTASLLAPAETPVVSPSPPKRTNHPSPNPEALETAEIDFRYAPRHWQTAICFPDDPKKSLVGQAGDLRYGFSKALMVGMEDFSSVSTFSLAGMQEDRIERQWLESASTPIVHTLIDRPTAKLELIAFASRHQDEGRADNVMMIVTPKSEPVATVGKIHVRTCSNLKFEESGKFLNARTESADTPFFVAAKIEDELGSALWWEEAGYTIYLAHGQATHDQPLRYLIRFPQDGQSAAQLTSAFAEPDTLLAAARRGWSSWQPFESIRWNYPDKHGEFLTACARNIQQAR